MFSGHTFLRCLHGACSRGGWRAGGVSGASGHQPAPSPESRSASSTWFYRFDRCVSGRTRPGRKAQRGGLRAVDRHPWSSGECECSLTTRSPGAQVEGRVLVASAASRGVGRAVPAAFGERRARRGRRDLQRKPSETLGSGMRVAASFQGTRFCLCRFVRCAPGGASKGEVRVSRKL